LFCFFSFLVTAPIKIGWAGFDDLYVKRHGHARKCLLGVPTLAKTAKGFIFPQTPQNWARNKGFQLEQKHEYSLTVHANLLKLAQSAQPGERNLKISTKAPKFSSMVDFFKTRPQWDFKPKKLC
jgi:hypothetical protein